MGAPVAWAVRDLDQGRVTSLLPTETDCPICFGTGEAEASLDWTIMCVCTAAHENMRGKRYAGSSHEQVLARANGFVAYVDRDMRPYIERAWLAGVHTWNSCQGGARHKEGPGGARGFSEGYVSVARTEMVWPLLLAWGWTTPLLRYREEDYFDGAILRFPSLDKMPPLP